MTFNRVLIDSNICLDAALYRKPFASKALKIFEVAEAHSIDLIIAAHAFDTIFYILRRDYSVKKAYALIQELRSISLIGNVTQEIIDTALKLRWPDFEDTIHYLTAVNTNCEAIITRDASGFQNSDIPILSPFEFLDQLES